MLFLTTEMVAPQVSAAQKTRYDTTRRSLAEEGLPLGSQPEWRPRRTGRLSRLTVRVRYPRDPAAPPFGAPTRGGRRPGQVVARPYRPPVPPSCSH